MALHLDAPFDDFDLPEPGGSSALFACAAAGDDTLHAEDALLLEFTRWLGARGAGTARRRLGFELAREALDQLGDPDAPWQGLPVERWLSEVASRVSPDARPNAIARGARDFVAWLADSGRLSLHGQRVLLQRLAALRSLDALGLAAAEPRLAA